MPASARSASPLSSPRAVSNASRAPVEASSSSDSAIWSSSTSPRRAVSAASSASPRLSWLLTATRVVTATVRIASLIFASLPTMRACVHGACRVSAEGGPESTEGTWTPSTPGLPSSRRRSVRTLARGRCVPWFAPGTNGQEVAVPPRSGPGTARIAPSACLSLPPASQLGQEVADTPQSGRTAPLRSHAIPLGPSAQACSTGNDRPTSRRFRAPDGRLLLRRQRSAREGPDSCPTWPFVAPPANARTGPSRAPHARA